MKKRTLVCFLIFTLCVFHFSITDTVFGQEATPQQLADQVYDEFSSTLTDNAVISGDVTVQDVIVGILNLLSSPAILENPTIASLGGFEAALNLVLGNPAFLSAVWPQIPQADLDKLPTQDVNDYIKLLNMASVQTLLKNATVRTLIQNSDAVKLLLAKIESPGDGDGQQPGDGDGQQPGDGDGQEPGDGDGQEPEPKPDPAPPTLSIITPTPTTERTGSFVVAFNTADVNNDPVTVTASISVDPVDAAGHYSSRVVGSRVQVTQTPPSAEMPTIPAATVTLTLVANDGTADSDPATFVINFATNEWQPPRPPPTGDLRPVNLVQNPLNPDGILGGGKSRLGGLSLNRIHLRNSIEQLIARQGLPLSSDAYDQAIDQVFDAVLMGIPQGVIPKGQIKQALKSRYSFSVFQTEAAQLDHENFGNAITPALTELLYQRNSEVPWGSEHKYLASDGMNLYVRVPDTLQNGNVQFRLNHSKAYPGIRIAPTEFQADTIPYIFKLEEALAATNLPAWPGSGLQIFSEVVLRYSQEGLDGEYISLQMDPYNEDKGVVWKGDVGIIPGRNVFYYFEVTLQEPVYLDIVNPIAFGEAILSPDGTHKQVIDEDPIEITHWVMPDPRNLQFQDRGIIADLFTTEVSLEILNVYNQINQGNRVNYDKLIGLLGNRARDLYAQFQEDFDPRLASVFTVPDINYETQSLWIPEMPISSIPDGQNRIEVVVRNAAGEDIDHIVVNFKADSSAPEASVQIGSANADTTGYWNNNSTFVSTNTMGGPAALLNINSALRKGILGRDDGYLLYQVIDLDKNGNLAVDAEGKPISTWLPLTVESTMLASDLWDIAIEQIKLSGDPNVSTALNLPLSALALIPGLIDSSPALSAYINEYPTATVRSVLDSPSGLDTVLSFITPPLLQELAQTETLLNALGIQPIDINEDRSKFIVALLDAVAKDIDAIPLTYDADRDMKMAFMQGDYGIRALGIDNLLNVSSHVPPTRLRVLAPEKEYDKVRISLARSTIRNGDLNGDGDYDEWYENNHIFSNTPNVQLTVMVDTRSDGKHPVDAIVLQYMSADGWKDLPGELQGELTLPEDEDAPAEGLKTVWNIPDDVFKTLVAAGNTIEVRAVATNRLQLTDPNPAELKITLDPDIHPVNPKVLVVDADDASLIDDINYDSGAPKGEITLIAYTPRRTYPETTSIKPEVMRATDDGWKIINTEEGNVPSEEIDAADMMFNGKSLGEIYPSNASMIHIDETSSYLKWTITVDTTMLDDTIDMGDLAAAHAASNPDGKSYVELDKNRYMVRATPVVDGDLPDNPNENPVAEGETYTDTFSVDNVDDVAPLGQNIITVSQDGVDVTANDDGSFDVGGLVDKYDPKVDSPVITLTITPGTKRDTYDSVELHTSLPDGAFMGEVTETAEGSGVYTVMVDIGTLMDADEHVHNDRYLEDWAIENPDELVYNPKGEVFSFTAYALTEDAAGNVQDKDDILNADLSTTTAHEIALNVQNTYRPDPGVLAIIVENSDGMTNADSGAPKYELTFNAYTYGLTSPPTEGVRFEVKRPGDETWERIPGTDEPPKEIDGSDLAGIVTGLVQITEHNTVSDGESEFAIPRFFP